MKSRSFRKSLKHGAALVAILGAYAGAAEATIIVNLDQTEFCTGGAGLCTTSKLDASATFDFYDDAGNVRIEFSFTNLSTFDTESKITDFGFDLVAGSVIEGQTLETGWGFASPEPPISNNDEPDDNPPDYCLTVGVTGQGFKCTAGQPGNGLNQGDTASFSLVVNTALSAFEYENAFLPNPITFRFRAIEDGVFDGGSVTAGVGRPTITIPEPGLLVLLGIGLLGTALVPRRQRA